MATITGTIAAGNTVTITSEIRMSNRQYHNYGRPTWWARIGGNFLKITWTRGDDYLAFDYTIPEDAEGAIEIHIGAGPNTRYGRRETVTLEIPEITETTEIDEIKGMAENVTTRDDVYDVFVSLDDFLTEKTEEIAEKLDSETKSTGMELDMYAVEAWLDHLADEYGLVSAVLGERGEIAGVTDRDNTAMTYEISATSAGWIAEAVADIARLYHIRYAEEISDLRSAVADRNFDRTEYDYVGEIEEYSDDLVCTDKAREMLGGLVSSVGSWLADFRIAAAQLIEIPADIAS